MVIHLKTDREREAGRQQWGSGTTSDTWASPACSMVIIVPLPRDHQVMNRTDPSHIIRPRYCLCTIHVSSQPFRLARTSSFSKSCPVLSRPSSLIHPPVRYPPRLFFFSFSFSLSLSLSLSLEKKRKKTTPSFSQ